MLSSSRIDMYIHTHTQQTQKQREKQVEGYQQIGSSRCRDTERKMQVELDLNGIRPERGSSALTREDIQTCVRTHTSARHSPLAHNPASSYTRLTMRNHRFHLLWRMTRQPPLLFSDSPYGLTSPPLCVVVVVAGSNSQRKDKKETVPYGSHREERREKKRDLTAMPFLVL